MIEQKRIVQWLEMPLCSIVTRPGTSNCTMRIKLKRSEKGLEYPYQVWEESNKCYEQKLDQQIESAEQTNEQKQRRKSG